MLIRFSVENFLSFCDEVEFSLLKGKTRQHSNHIINVGDFKLLRGSAIYGANASGKSNLVKAMAFARSLIVDGTDPNVRIPTQPFKFSSECRDKPSTFTFEFHHRGRNFAYGFRVDARQIHEEWLYEIKKSSEKMLFERKTIDGKTQVEFGSLLNKTQKERDFFDFLAQGTRPNQLFLYETIDRATNEFEDAYSWFRDALVIIFPDSRYITLELQLMFNQTFKENLETMLNGFDTGIDGVAFQEIDFDDELDVPDLVKRDIEKELYGQFDTNDSETGVVIVPDRNNSRYVIYLEDGNILASKLMTLHKVVGEDKPMSLEISDESDGTQRLFDVIPMLLELTQGDKVFIIDEIGRSLHPDLAYKIMAIFFSAAASKSQLIVTTHEDRLLDFDLMRRDEIWFVQKDRNGASDVYSLEEFDLRNDKKIRRGYQQGRYGGVPVMGKASLKTVTES